MIRHLPTINPERTEFGFCRTECDCDDCTRNCMYIPGYLLPADLERIHERLAFDQDLFVWARQHILASPGAVVTRDGLAFRIPTLVPARSADGACIFLTAGGRCAIHANSPYGCAFFDSHMPAIEADRRSKHGLLAILDAWNAGSLYAQVWLALATDRLVAPPPEFARERLRQSRHDCT